MNKSLPIYGFCQKIVQTIRANPVTIIVAETGAGKSTQVPQLLLQEGLTVLATQPRRLAARTVAKRVAEEIGESLGQTIGFRTAYERLHSRATRCLFVTDGLALVREMLGVGKADVLIVDEVHEWNLNIEVLIAWSKLQLAQGAKFKLVIMSATLEAEKLSAYFGNAPVINVPGRQFPVEERPAGTDLVSDVISLIREGRNVLVFEPGKAEIAKTIEDIGQVVAGGAVILALHGELTPDDQDKCFRSTGATPKCVVSTNVAQTSITIDDIDAVVDSGEERRIEVADGVEGLYIRPISIADSRQRKGRAGRTKPGVYINHCPAVEQAEFPTAEILRSRLDQTVLRLAQVGFDMEELEFFHQPAVSEIHNAKESLRTLGCLTDQNTVTEIGAKVAAMPVSTHLGRMIVAADELGVVDDMVTIAAILENGEITDRKNPIKWQLAFCPTERESDVLAQLAVYNGVRGKGMDKDDLIACGVHPKAYWKTVEMRKHLAESLRGKVKTFASSGDRTAIVKALCVGMVDHVFRQEGFSSYRNGSDTRRELNKSSVIYSAQLLVGLPFDLSIKDRYDPEISRTLNLITMATKVTAELLMDVAPHLVTRTMGKDRWYDAGEDAVACAEETRFNGILIASVKRIVERPNWDNLPYEWTSKSENQTALAGRLYWKGPLDPIGYGSNRYGSGYGQYSTPAIYAKPVPKPPEKPQAFTDVGGRYFDCSCGCKERMTGSDWKRYVAGEGVSLTCTKCKRTKEVKK